MRPQRAAASSARPTPQAPSPRTPTSSCFNCNRAQVLNDLWVSVPTGSEDFSFKIMRKNVFEDALFRCEDERHEIDMVLDNNAAAIRVLEPLADEIAALKVRRTPAASPTALPQPPPPPPHTHTHTRTHPSPRPHRPRGRCRSTRPTASSGSLGWTGARWACFTSRRSRGCTASSAPKCSR